MFGALSAALKSVQFPELGSPLDLGSREKPRSAHCLPGPGASSLAWLSSTPQDFPALLSGVSSVVSLNNRVLPEAKPTTTTMPAGPAN